MKNNNSNTTEQALFMYKENILLDKKNLKNILNQIPEKKFYTNYKQQIRSPYIWIALTEMFMLCSVLIALYPNLNEFYVNRNNPFYLIDKEIDHFDSYIQYDDAENGVTFNKTL